MSAPTRLTLRDLPVPAKLVLSAFLMSVGIGYLSAMVQLHMKHSARDGNPLPGPDEVIERFSGLKRFDPTAPPEKCKISLLLGGDVNAPDVSKENMAPAFKAKSKGYEKLCAARGKATVDAERDGEWNAMIQWVTADANVRKASYDADAFAMPANWAGKPMTAEFLTGDGAVKIKSLFDARCQNCHANQAPDLGNYGAIEPHATAPSQDVIDGKWVRSSKQITTEALTQSTHAHLLSFSVLFTCTGLVFAFTGLPGFVRGTVGPVVLIAQVCDIACWWLARVPAPLGPVFAQTIMATGAVVGLGLTCHILGGLFGMWGPKGKVVLALLCLIGFAGIVVVMATVIKPALDEQRSALAKPAPVGPAEGDKKDTPPPTKPAANGGEKVVGPNAPAPQIKPLSQLEKLLAGKWDDKSAKFNGKGTMVPAFFEKDGAGFKNEFKERGDAVVAEREGERAAVVAWIKLDDAARKAAYEADALPMPTELGGKPITPDYVTDDKATVKVKSILTDRCARCHASGSDQEDYPLEDYAQIAKYLATGGEVKPAAANGEAKPAPTAEAEPKPIPPAN